ncbi:MAG TPA: hypothetical protein VJM74_01040 [Nitrososphaeraceae archaeon]|nr:hypothetical protein [Nitrososphaeraceae archaeon]
MIKPSTAGYKLTNDAKSKTVMNLGELHATAIRQRDNSEEEAFFEILRDIQALDIIMSLNNLGCYTLPNRSLVRALNFAGLQQKLVKRKMMFEEVVKRRKFRKMFGFYGYKLLELCSVMSLGEGKSKNSYWEI